MSKIFIGFLVYNGERFLSKALDSLRVQSYTDWKIYISDDASTDGTAEICKQYAREDDRIIYYRQEKNIGLYGNYKFLIDRADCPYFMWACHDDLWEKDFLKVCVEQLEKDNGVGIAMTGIANIDSRGNVVREIPKFALLSGKPNFITVSRFLLQPEIFGKCMIMCGIFRTEAIRNAWNIYPQRPESGSDYIFALAAVSHYGVGINPRVLFKKRMGGISDSQNNRRDGEMIVIIEPKNYMFSVGGGRFGRCLKNSLRAVTGTPYKPLVFCILMMRSIRAWILFFKTRNYRKRMQKIIPDSILKRVS